MEELLRLLTRDLTKTPAEALCVLLESHFCAGRAPNHAYRPAVYAAQNEDSVDSLM